MDGGGEGLQGSGRYGDGEIPDRFHAISFGNFPPVTIKKDTLLNVLQRLGNTIGWPLCDPTFLCSAWAFKHCSPIL